jgi:hypothetical protein
MSEWTREKPTQTGYYWLIEPGGEPQPVEVSKVNKSLVVYGIDRSFDWELSYLENDCLWCRAEPPALPGSRPLPRNPVRVCCQFCKGSGQVDNYDPRDGTWIPSACRNCEGSGSVLEGGAQ